VRINFYMNFNLKGGLGVAFIECYKATDARTEALTSTIYDLIRSGVGNAQQPAT